MNEECFIRSIKRVWFIFLCKLSKGHFWYYNFSNLLLTCHRKEEMPIEKNTAWIRAWLCKLQKRVHSTRSRKSYSLPVTCPWSVVLSGYYGFFHH